MFRAIPTNNKLCFDKQLKRSWKIHEDKIRTIKSSISKKPPAHYTFLDQRAKRSALDNVRNLEIQKQNSSLLTKMKVICEKGNNTSYLKNQVTCDKRKTLNEGFRKRELVKIVEENQELIKRIYEKKSAFNVKKWQKERKEIEKNINLISSFPYKDYPCTHTRVNLWMTQEDGKNRSENFSISKSRIRRQDFMFSGTHKIGESFYLVETKMEDKMFVIEIENLQKIDQKYRLEMTQKEAVDLLQKSFNGNLINLLNTLYIDEQKGTCQLQCITGQETKKEPNEQ